MRVMSFVVILSGMILGSQARRTSKYAKLVLPASPGEFPHHASLQVNGTHVCSGSLISYTHVITAAQCIRNLMNYSAETSNALSVEVGSVKLGEGQSYLIKRLSAKNDYRFHDADPSSPFIRAHDIGIVTLKDPVEESPLVRPILLGSPFKAIESNSVVVVSGFGNSTTSKSRLPALQKTVMRVVSGEKCDEHYYVTLQKRILPSQICARLDLGHGLCQADVGAPLIQKNRLIGIYSADSSNCHEGKPQLFTNILHYLPYLHYELTYHNFDKSEDADTPADAENFNIESDEVLKDVTEREASIEDQYSEENETEY